MAEAIPTFAAADTVRPGEPDLPREILPLLAPALRPVVWRAFQALGGRVEEIRLAVERPLVLVGHSGDACIGPAGEVVEEAGCAYHPGRDDVARTFQLLAQGSVYAWEEELKNGYLTLPGGHRVGLCGRAVVENGLLKTLHPVASLNIRLARALPGAAWSLLPYLLEGAGVRLCSTLIVSPPRAGKTTVLRDLVRLVSTGVPSLGLAGCRVAVVDERSEIAGCTGGVPQRDVGPRTDVLDACPKALGMMLLIRSMAPAVLAVDEIGRAEDARAVLEALHAGVAVLATAHAWDLAELGRRPAFAELLPTGAFRRAALLGRSLGPGTVELVMDLIGQRPLTEAPWRLSAGGV